MSLVRYRIGEGVGSATITDDMMLLTTVYGLAAGTLLTVLAHRLRQRWMVFWGAGLALISLAYLLAALLGLI
ncbi:MAG: hypothetical protein CL395_08140 [Acidiferrobacteraceae bacterium]|nr:hypothetical protein [Acidiferrobacteraceae bacterium]MCP4827300.1 hypothetical protein [Pseudomonadota bacterium]HJP06712.1 hypothetical protein [Arenicellales bacterium]